MSSIDWHKTHYRSTFRQVKDLLRHAGFKLTAALGFHWIPVSRASNNRYIPLYTILEKVFYLNAIKTLSPWVIAMAKKL
jgi:hypothetical protein